MKHVNASQVTNSAANSLKQFKQLFSALAIFLLFTPLAWSTTYYVSTSGNDASSGMTLSAPFKTIQKAMNTAIAGDTVYVRGGTYREQVDVTQGGGVAGKMVNLLAYNQEVPVIKGSDVVTGWTQYSGNIWKKSGWPYNSQQVFVGGSDTPSLQQIGMPKMYTSYEYPSPVGTGLSSMIAGSFYYDPASSSLYVWLADGSDPNTKYVEASTRRRLLFMAKPYIYVKGFAFRHSNMSLYTQQGSAVELSSYSVLEQSDVQYTDFAGIGLGYMQTGARVINCNVSNNGDSGINAPASYDFLVSNSVMKNNNTRNFNQLWHAGGFKAATKAWGTVENSEVANNNGSGIWFDYANGGSPIIVRNNYIHNNGPKEAAIFMEVSKNGLIYNNVISNNKRRGIYISASDDMRVYNNTLYGTSDYAGIELGGMPRTGGTLTNNSVLNNIVANGSSKYDIAIAAANGTTILGNTSDYNDIYRASGAIQLYLGSLFTSVSSFSTSSKLDVHSLSVNPGFVSATSPTMGSSFAIGASSPVIDKGTTAAGATYDYLNVARPIGGAFDMGAFEYASTSTSTPTASTIVDTIPPVVSIANPLQGAIVKKGSSVTITAKATDNVGVTGMSLYVDGGSNVRSSSGQISYTWSSSKASIGSHSIKVSATDASANLGTQYITFKVQ